MINQINIQTANLYVIRKYRTAKQTTTIEQAPLLKNTDKIHVAHNAGLDVLVYSYQRDKSRALRIHRPYLYRLMHVLTCIKLSGKNSLRVARNFSHVSFYEFLARREECFACSVGIFKTREKVTCEMCESCERIWLILIPFMEFYVSRKSVTDQTFTLRVLYL